VDGAADAYARKAKLAALKVGVGYRITGAAFAGLEARRDAFGNAARSARFELEHALKKLGTPVDRSVGYAAAGGQWVNLPAMNAINFPAAILQPPFFRPGAPGAHGLRRDRRGHRT
jgi:predicted metalloendopeptidase